jgi:hypothetical protein
MFKVESNGVDKAVRQEVVLSLSKTPWSRASCSKVIGRKDPRLQVSDFVRGNDWQGSD